MLHQYRYDNEKKTSLITLDIQERSRVRKIYTI
jgi:hypothetical protein